MCQKAVLFADNVSLQNIQRESDPVIIKQLGKQIQNFDKRRWEGAIDSILDKGLSAKFGQNPTLLFDLRSTGSTTLAEANPADKLFGIGRGLNNLDAWDQNKWLGKNKLGSALMHIRDTTELQTLV